MQLGDGVLSRRGFLRGVGATCLSGGAFGNVAQVTVAEDRTTIVPLETESFRGYVGAAEQVIPFTSRTFVVPCLTITPITYETFTGSGIAVGPREGAGSIRTETSGGPISPEDATEFQFTIPEVSASDYEDEIIGYRVNGELRWELSHDSLGPAPARLEYTLKHEPSGSIVSKSDNCRAGQPTHTGADTYDRIFSNVRPGDTYSLLIGASRGSIPWELSIDIQVITDSPRPRLGNENAERPEQKTTSLDEISGVGVDVVFDADGMWDNDIVVMLQNAVAHTHDSDECQKPNTYGGGRWVGDGNGYYFYTTVEPGPCQFATKPSGTIVEWEITANIVKEVIVG